MFTCVFTQCVKRPYDPDQYRTGCDITRAAAIYCDTQILQYGLGQYVVLYWRHLVCRIAIGVSDGVFLCKNINCSLIS